MAGESFYAYVGTRGSGKTHEGSKRILEQVWLGRDTVVVNPEFRIDRLVEALNDRDLLLSLGDGHPDPVEYFAGLGMNPAEFGVRQFTHEQVSRYCRVFDYEVLELAEGFWPREDEMQVSRDSDGNLVYGKKWRADGWRRSLVRAGSFVVVDEAWRIMDDATRIPVDAKKMFRMMRHWRGPIDWRDPADVDRYLSDAEPWHPGLGGGTDFGGDGTLLVSMNLLVLTQDYHSLDQKLRRQVNQITDLYTYPSGHIAKWLSRLNSRWDVEGKYSATTFNSHLLPYRWTPKHFRDRNSFEQLPHLPGVHRLTEKAGGQAVEARIDNRSTMSGSVEAQGLRRFGWTTVVILVVTLSFLGWFIWSRMSSDDTPRKPASVSSKPVDPPPGGSLSGAPSAASAAPSAPRPTQSQELPVARVAGQVGDVLVVVRPNGLTSMAAPSSYVHTPEMGYAGSLDGVSVNRWSGVVLGGDGSRDGRDGARPAVRSSTYSVSGGVPARIPIPDSVRPHGSGGGEDG